MIIEYEGKKYKTTNEEKESNIKVIITEFVERLVKEMGAEDDSEFIVMLAGAMMQYGEMVFDCINKIDFETLTRCIELKEVEESEDKSNEQ
jgi:hypothetical protein